MSNLLQNTSEPHLVGESRDDSAQRESKCGTSSHNQSDSDFSWDDIEFSTEHKLKGIFTVLLLAYGQQGKLRAL